MPSNTHGPLPTNYTLHGETLEVVTSARYLGVDIADDLSWKTHVTRITNNANKSLGFVRRNLKSNKEDIKRIESIQRRAARWVPILKRHGHDRETWMAYP